MRRPCPMWVKRWQKLCATPAFGKSCRLARGSRWRSGWIKRRRAASSPTAFDSPGGNRPRRFPGAPALPNAPLKPPPSRACPFKRAASPIWRSPLPGTWASRIFRWNSSNWRRANAYPSDPASHPVRQWHNCYVKAPVGEFKIVARHSDGTGWFAFKAPREVGRLSFWAVAILRAWRYLLVAGLALLVFNLVSRKQQLTQRRQEPQRRKG